MKHRKPLLGAIGLALIMIAVDSMAQGIRLPSQGFEATGQLPANYTKEEAAAVEVIKKWIETTNSKDLDAHMALIDPNIVFRGDPTGNLGHGPQAYCAAFGFVRGISFVRTDQLFVIGGPNDVLALLKRTDINSPAGSSEGALGGFDVAVGNLVRVKNGKITEWYDAPINRVSIAALPQGALGGRGGPPPGAGAAPPGAGAAPAGAGAAAPRAGGAPQARPIPESCKKYPVGGN